MKKSLILLVAALACSTTLTFAANKHEKSEPSPKNEHEVTVGNEKAASSGSTADSKAVKQEKTNADRKHKKGSQKHEKGDHEPTVGNEKAAESGSLADDKTVKQEKTHTDDGNHKSTGNSKK